MLPIHHPSDRPSPLWHQDPPLRLRHLRPVRDQPERVAVTVSGRGSRDLFERFTERARQVVVLAQDEARALKHNYIGTEHILLGLLREEERTAARVPESP